MSSLPHQAIDSSDVSYSDKPGGGSYKLRPGVGPILLNVASWWREQFSRPRAQLAGMWVTSLDAHQRPPQWLERKDVTVLGYRKTKQDRDDTWYENKYAKELAISEAFMEKKAMEKAVAQHDFLGSLRWIGQKFGIAEPTMEDPRAVKEKALEVYETRLVEAQKEQQRKVRDWKDFMLEVIETDKPLYRVIGKHRRRVDCYGFDDFLDNAPGVLWLAFKIGAVIGAWVGGLRALNVLNVDAHFMQVSGIGILTFMNVSVATGLCKWVGNIVICAAFFLFGDRSVTAARSLWLPENVKPERTVLNYTVGCSLAYSAVGILPYWILNDVKMGLRFALSGAALGAVVGTGLGFGFSNLLALNLKRLYFSQEQFCSYKALMAYQREYVAAEMVRLKKEEKAKYAAYQTYAD